MGHPHISAVFRQVNGKSWTCRILHLTMKTTKMSTTKSRNRKRNLKKRRNRNVKETRFNRSNGNDREDSIRTRRRVLRRRSRPRHRHFCCNSNNSSSNSSSSNSKPRLRRIVPRRLNRNRGSPACLVSAAIEEAALRRKSSPLSPSPLSYLRCRNQERCELLSCHLLYLPR